MASKDEGGEVWFSVGEGADLLGLKRQALYLAIRADRLRTDGANYGQKIHIRDLLGYGLRSGRDAEAIVRRVQAASGLDWTEMLYWVLASLGLGWMVAPLIRKDKEAPSRAGGDMSAQTR